MKRKTRQIVEQICLKCKHRWFPRVETPKVCPKCHCYMETGSNKRRTA